MKIKKEIEIKNKKAFHDYEIVDKFEAGLSLLGSEIKSIRLGSVTFTDSYCLFNSETELFVKSLHIAEYENSSYDSHETKRDRKLLLTKKELIKLQDKVKIKGYTIIPLKMYIKNGWAKLQIGLVKGKKLHNKKNSIKEKDLKRDQDREMKNY